MTQKRKNKIIAFTAFVLLGCMMIAVPELALAQNVSKTAETGSADLQTLSNAYLVSNIIGDTIINDSDETKGKINHLMLTSHDKQSAYVIISFNRRFRIGTYLIALPYSDLRITTSKIALPVATTNGLKIVPELKCIIT